MRSALSLFILYAHISIRSSCSALPVTSSAAQCSTTRSDGTRHRVEHRLRTARAEEQLDVVLRPLVVICERGESRELIGVHEKDYSKQNVVSISETFLKKAIDFLPCRASMAF